MRLFPLWRRVREGSIPSRTRRRRFREQTLQGSPARATWWQKPAGKKKNTVSPEVLGGKNVFYFLTPLDKGRLQTLPLAYDMGRKEWFDMAASGVRHFPGGG